MIKNNAAGKGGFTMKNPCKILSLASYNPAALFLIYLLSKHESSTPRLMRSIYDSLLKYMGLHH